MTQPDYEALWDAATIAAGHAALHDLDPDQAAAQVLREAFEAREAEHLATIARLREALEAAVHHMDTVGCTCTFPSDNCCGVAISRTALNGETDHG